MQDRLTLLNVLHAPARNMTHQPNELHSETIMKTSTRPNRLNIDLQNLKQPWLDYCRQRGVTPSEGFRQIVVKLTKAETKPVRQLKADARRSVRRAILLTAAEAGQIEACAASEGFSPSRWIVALIRARLTRTPQLGQRELELLAQSNLQLLSIGRNLNQLARAANNGIAIETGGRELFVELKTAVMRHAEQVGAAMTANVRRWSR